MKILNFGSCNIDHVYTLDHIVRSGETEATEQMETFAGGKGLNQSIAVARAGATVFHAGCVGADGAWLRDLLAADGVDVTYLATASVPTGHAVIQVSHAGENAIFLYPGANGAVSRAQIDEVLSHFDAGDVLLLQNEISNVPYLVEQAHEKGMYIVLNPSPINEELRTIDLAKISCLILNEVEAEALTGETDVQKSLDLLQAEASQTAIVLTLGAKGSVYADGKTRIPQSAYRVPVADTTAAGDTFTGYYLAALADGVPPKERLRIATAASALAVMKKGAAPSIPRWEEARRALADFEKKEETHHGE